jgi:hypothetical protein
MEQPKDEIDAIMNVNFGQNNGVVRMELFVNDELTGPGFGASPNSPNSSRVRDRRLDATFRGLS